MWSSLSVLWHIYKILIPVSAIRYQFGIFIEYLYEFGSISIPQFFNKTFSRRYYCIEKVFKYVKVEVHGNKLGATIYANATWLPSHGRLIGGRYRNRTYQPISERLFSKQRSHLATHLPI